MPGGDDHGAAHLVRLVVAEDGRRYHKLPLAIPIVCYNGRPVWWPSLDLAGMLRVPPGPERLVPRLRYLLIDEHRVADGQLDEENLLAGLIGQMVIYKLPLLEPRSENGCSVVCPRLPGASPCDW